MSGSNDRPPPDYTELGDVIKSPLDSNEYSAIKLCSNDLKALLICNKDQEVDIQGDRHGKATCAFQRILEFNEKYVNINCAALKAKKLPSCCKKKDKSGPFTRMCRGKAARGEEEKGLVILSLTIGAGKLNDPADGQGIAHFCEHGVLLHSKNYPEGEAYEKYIMDNGGEANARTEEEYTKFFLTINKDSLEEALRMLVDCLVNPTMDKVELLNELQVLESEFASRKHNDDLQIISVHKVLTKDGHPCGFFGDGSELSLNAPEMYENLVKWQKRNYCGNYMTLVIKGPIQIPKLKTMVSNIFSVIPRGEPQTPAESIAHHGAQPFVPERWNKFYKVVPFLSQDILKVTWCLGPEMWKNYKTKPLLFIQWLFENKADGGLVQYLKRKGWIFNACISCITDSDLKENNFMTSFSIQFTLTNTGFKEYVDVLKMTFAFIEVLKTGEQCERLYDEFKILNADLFHYMSDRNLESPFGMDDDQYEGSLILILDLSVRLQTQDPENILISKFLVSEFDQQVITECLNQLSPEGANILMMSSGFENCNLQTKWFETKYCVEEITCLADLKEAVVPPEMFLPPPNRYLEETLCYPLDGQESFITATDKVILKTAKTKIYYLKTACIQGYLPTARYVLKIYSIESNTMLQGTWCMTDVISKALENYIQLNLGTALNALISCDFEWKDNYLEVQIFGPSNRLPDILDTALNAISNIDTIIDVRTFQDLTELSMDSIHSTLDQAEKLAQELKDSILKDRHISASRHINFLTRIRYTDFIRFCSSFKKVLYIHGELTGCVTKTQIKKITQTITKLDYSPWQGARWFSNVDHAIDLPKGERCLRIQIGNEKETTSCVSNHYQFGKLTKTQSTLFDVLDNTKGFENFVFCELRTNEHLAYLVDVAFDDYLSVNGLTISISAIQTSKFTTAYVDERIDAIIQKYYETFIMDPVKFKEDITSFLNADEKLTHAEAITFFKDYLLPDGKEYCKVSIQVIGHLYDSNATPKDTTEDKILEKIKKNSKPSDENTYNEDFEYPINKTYPYKYLLPKGLTHRDGYFITDIQRFKNQQFTYGNDSPSSPPSSDENNSDEDSSKCDCAGCGTNSTTEDTKK